MMASTDRPAQYVSFVLATEEYAVSILRAREIVAYDVITRVPMAPAGVRGVLNLRGRVVPVIDLASRLGLPPTEPTRWTCILMVEVEFAGEPALMGMMIDAVSEVIDLAPADIEPPPAFGVRVHLDYLAGIGKVGKKIVLLLDIDRILSTEEILAASSLDLEAEEPPFGELPLATKHGEAPPPTELGAEAAPVEGADGA
jgi:purine-binding chemotaxis protein CheW